MSSSDHPGAGPHHSSELTQRKQGLIHAHIDEFFLAREETRGCCRIGILSRLKFNVMTRQSQWCSSLITHQLGITTHSQQCARGCLPITPRSRKAKWSNHNYNCILPLFYPEVDGLIRRVRLNDDDIETIRKVLPERIKMLLLHIEK